MLQAYLVEGAGKPFVWGQTDCCPWAAEWCRRVAGVDVFAVCRGQYHDLRSYARYVRKAGGFEQTVFHVMRLSGLPETQEPRLGDVGLVMTGNGPMGAIRLATGWALKTVDGIAIREFPAIAAWRV